MSMFKRLRKQKDGATAVEFALVAPIFFLLMMGIVEFSLIMFASSVVENATTMAARYGITGDNYSAPDAFQQNTAGLSREAFIESAIKDLSSGLLDPEKVDITHKTFSSLGSGAQTSSGAYGDGGDTVLYTVTYAWPIFTPLFGEFFADGDGNFTITSAVLVANEEF